MGTLRARRHDVPCAKEEKYNCRWAYVPGPHRRGRPTQTMVWICAYPFSTVRIGGPCEECPAPRRDETTQSLHVVTPRHLS